MSNKTIKISEKNYEKLNEIKDIQGLKSINQVIDSLLPEGTITEANYNQEPPAFTIDDKIITWNKLRNTEIGTTWGTINIATIIYKDQYGTLIRFKYENETFIEYYNFI